MSDQVASLTTEPMIFQLGLPPGNGSASCTDCCIALIIRHEKGKTVTANQVRHASGHVGGDYTGLTPREALTALAAFGVTGFSYISNVSASDVLVATDRSLVLAGVGYWAYPSQAQAEVGGKNDFGFGGPHAIIVAGRRYWATKPAGWASGTFTAGWRFWGRDPDHRQGWGAKYDRARTSWLVRAMGALVGMGTPPWPCTFMIAKGVSLKATQAEEPGFDLPIDAHGDVPDASGAAPVAVAAVEDVPAPIVGKLGLLAPKGAPALKLASFLTGVVPAHPAVADNLALVQAWILGANDKYGVCGPVAVANNVLQVTTYLSDTPLVVTQADIFDLYRRSGNPDFDPATGAGDRGVDMQTMLEALLAGGIGGKKPIAFAQVEGIDEVRAVISIFGGSLFGLNLEEAQKAQTVTGTWDDVPGSPPWGGHAVLGGDYVCQPPQPDRLGLISWAEEIETTDAFLGHELGQAWVVIWPEHLGTKQFQEGISLDGLKAAFKALTGRDLVIPAEPVPPASPKVTPIGCAGLLALIVAVAALVMT